MTTVKLMRQLRRNLLATCAKPGGFFIEIATYHAFKRGKASGNDHADYFVSALAAVSAIITDYVTNGVELDDPTLPGKVISVRATEDEFATLRDRLADAATRAEDALREEDMGKAAIVFRDLLGKDPDGEWIFPMPPGYNEDGTKKNLSSGSSDVPGGNRRHG